MQTFPGSNGAIFQRPTRGWPRFRLLLLSPDRFASGSWLRSKPKATAMRHTSGLPSSSSTSTDLSNRRNERELDPASSGCSMRISIRSPFGSFRLRDPWDESGNWYSIFLILFRKRSAYSSNCRRFLSISSRAFSGDFAGLLKGKTNRVLPPSGGCGANPSVSGTTRSRRRK